MINRFALSFLCIELDRNVRFGVTLLYILLAMPNDPYISANRCLNGVYCPSNQLPNNDIAASEH